ncbi:MAG TPA: ATP-binding protein [Planctomycetaceae bacterium]|nr:ATP-binding protein [Planctomycetaceae bacterium]
MSEPRWIWQCDRIIPSKNGAGRKVRREVLEELKRHDWSKHDVFSIHLALEEALVNAIEHGNDLDPGKRVQVRCQLADDLVRIEVVDEGPGFDPAQVPDPTDDEHRERPGGRGVLLMRRFMDRVEYSSKGNSVVLEKRRSADPA